MPQGLDPIETASRDEIAALQRERLAWTLRHAHANVPHYRHAFAAAGAHPDDFRDLGDLARFPFTTRSTPPAAGRGCCSTTPMATACSPAALACISAPSGSAAPSSRPPAA
jgi:phenylacetate-coenzyme A ligase PaaK-like adenylate-forming protein